MRKRSLIWIVAGMAALSPGAAAADTLEVTKKGDPDPGTCTASDCSLREAVLEANQRMGADRIVLPSRRGAYRLARASTNEDGALDGDLDVTNDPLSILHPGPGVATIDGRGIDRVLHVFDGAPLSLTKIIVTGGDADPGSANGSGGGILATADVRLSRSRLIGNSAVDDGGGVSIQEDSGASLTVKRSTITRNFTADDGGGIAIESDEVGEATGRLVVARSRVTRNEAENNFGGGIFVQRPLRITKTTVDRNRSDNAAGIGVEEAASLRIADSAVTRNVARNSEGGGLEIFQSSGLMTNVTVAKNRAFSEGGGLALYDNPSLRLNAVTIAGNTADSSDAAEGEGGGILLSGTVQLDNTILAGNRVGTDPGNCAGDTPASGGHNLADSGGGACGLGAADVLGRPARLGRLGRNGGPTETVPLKASSPAVNEAGNDAPARDQRGVRRRNPDIGAFELD